ncbi:unnamed protein product [Linum trigynum]|uniref:Uncharacterized protein n=1 Tax=Linum trigynum TaxID=586398 RepID=A0AAV2DVB0_9ROSI
MPTSQPFTTSCFPSSLSSADVVAAAASPSSSPMPTATPDLRRVGCPHRPAAPAVPAIMIEIYAAAWLRDVKIGSVRVLISNLFPSSGNGNNNHNNAKMRFVALQIRRPSGRPQGILNMGVQLLDNTMRSMPLYTELSTSGVGFNDLLDAKATAGGAKNLEEKTAKLRRTKSDRTDLTSADNDTHVTRSAIGMLPLLTDTYQWLPYHLVPLSSGTTII